MNIKIQLFCSSLILIVLGTCTQKDEHHNINRDRKTVRLINGLGEIAFNCPARYDTAFQWVHYSDCGSCHIQKYRYQPKKRNIYPESGFYWYEPKDSIDRFTITHDFLYFPSTIDTVEIKVDHFRRFRKKLSVERPDMDLIWDTIYQINGRYFSICSFQGTGNFQRKKEVAAATIFRGNDIEFICELMSGVDSVLYNDFVERSIELINSISITQ